MRLIQEKGIVFVLKPADHQAGVDGDSINLARAGHVTFLLQFGTIVGNAILKLFEGASDGAKTTAKTFKYYLTDAEHGAANADKFGAVAESAALTLTAATYDNKILAIEFAAEELTDGMQWVTLEVGAEADTLNLAAVAVLSKLRYGHGVSALA